MATAQPNTGTASLPPTVVPAPTPQTPLAQLSTYDAGTAANSIDSVNSGTYNTDANGNITVQNGVATRTVDPNETASGQLQQLESANSPLEQLAYAQGANAAAATGNANGSLMSGAAQTALLQNLTPIATSNAATYERDAQANQDALNTAANTRRQVAGQLGAAGISANASMHNAQLAAQTAAASLAQNQQQFTTNWANEFQQAKNSQAFTLADQASQNQFNLGANALNTAVSTIFSDPSYWNNPQGAMGMLNFFGSNINDLVDNLFPDQTGAAQQGYAANGYTPAAPNPTIPNATLPQT